MHTEMEQAILQALQDLKEGQSSLKSDVGSLKSDVGSLKDQGKNTNRKVEALDKNMGTLVERSLRWDEKLGSLPSVRKELLERR
jgi:FtsZ-binding cell division protein ZapB